MGDHAHLAENDRSHRLRWPSAYEGHARALLALWSQPRPHQAISAGTTGGVPGDADEGGFAPPAVPVSSATQLAIAKLHTQTGHPAPDHLAGHTTRGRLRRGRLCRAPLPLRRVRQVTRAAPCCSPCTTRFFQRVRGPSRARHLHLVVDVTPHISASPSSLPAATRSSLGTPSSKGGVRGADSLPSTEEASSRPPSVRRPKPSPSS